MESVRRFAKVAELSVGVIVGTGILQAVRLEGNPVKLFTVNHGRYLLFKLVILAGGDYPSRLRCKLRVDRQFRLALNKISARRNEPRNRPNVGFDFFNSYF